MPIQTSRRHIRLPACPHPGRGSPLGGIQQGTTRQIVANDRTFVPYPDLLCSGTLYRVKLDSAGLRVLSREECITLLASVPIGRIVYTERALPAVQPVNFVLDGEAIVIRTAIGSRLATAAANTVVAFEADEFDRETHTGWSVTAVGRARAVDDPAEILYLSRLPLETWTPDSREHFIVVYPEELSGRQI